MTPAEIATIKALCDAATPGPWGNFRLAADATEAQATYVRECIDRGSGPFFLVMNPGGDADVCHTGNGPTSEANARLIAAARTALPAALSALEEARAAMALVQSGSDMERAGRLAAESALEEARREATDRVAAAWAEADKIGARLAAAESRAEHLAGTLATETAERERVRALGIAAESRADALQRERDEMEKSKWYERDRRKEAESRADAAWREALEAAATICERMVVTGRAWTTEQEIVAQALFHAVAQIRALPPPSATAAPAEKRDGCSECADRQCYRLLSPGDGDEVDPTKPVPCPTCGNNPAAPAECPRCLAFRNGTPFDRAAQIDHSPGCSVGALAVHGLPAAPAEEKCPECEGTGKCACGAKSCKTCWTCHGTGRAPPSGEVG